ncbi:MAG: hypothetical protein KDA42_09685 [Planctomycetales bacterium]|nr:hypothetical protein [Planctomycetales bacterium]
MRLLYSLITVAAVLTAVSAAQAGGHGCDSGCCEVQCPNCDHTCHFSVGTEPVDKHCYGVACEPICIPKVVFPWQKKCCNDGCGHGCKSGCDSGCDCASGACGCCAKCEEPNCSCVNNGACVRYVRKLKKYEYQCEKCKYKWEAVPACGGCCDHGAAPAPEAAPAPPAVPADAAANYDPAYGFPAVGASYGQ